jgi:hypothetical protein
MARELVPPMRRILNSKTQTRDRRYLGAQQGSSATVGGEQRERGATGALAKALVSTPKASAAGICDSTYI